MIVCMSYMHTHGNVIIPYYKRITLQNIRNFIRKWSYLKNLQLQCELQQVHNQACMEQRYTVKAILDSWTHIIYVYIRIIIILSHAIMQYYIGMAINRIFIDFTFFQLTCQGAGRSRSHRYKSLHKLRLVPVSSSTDHRWPEKGSLVPASCL